MQIWIDENIPWRNELFSSLGQINTFAGRSLRAEQLINADALLVRSVTQVGEDLLKNTKVNFVGTATIGEDHIDKNYLQSKKIGFASAPGSNANSVAEYITSALAHLSQRENFSLENKTLGIIGWGRVGKKVEEKALALGLHVLRNDPPLADTNTFPSNHFVGLNDLLASSDIVTIHVPLVKTGLYPTLQMVNDDFLRTIKKGALLFNTSRGKVLDENALKNQCSRLAGWILDVYPTEPEPTPFLIEEALLATPHIAGYSTIGKLTASLMLQKALFQQNNISLPALPNFPAPDKIKFQKKLGELTCTSWQSAVLSVYDIAEDFIRFKEARREMGASKGFDECRKKYPIRLEFPQYSINWIKENWKNTNPETHSAAVSLINHKNNKNSAALSHQEELNFSYQVLNELGFNTSN